MYEEHHLCGSSFISHASFVAELVQLPVLNCCYTLLKRTDMIYYYSLYAMLLLSLHGVFSANFDIFVLMPPLSLQTSRFMRELGSRRVQIMGEFKFLLGKLDLFWRCF